MLASDTQKKLKYQLSYFKDVRAKIFYNTDLFRNCWFFSYFCNSQMMSYLCKKCKKNWGVTNYPNFDKSSLVTGHSLSGCYLKNIKNTSLKTHFFS